MLILNHEEIGRSTKEMLLVRDRKITRAATKDGNEVVKIKEKVKPF